MLLHKEVYNGKIIEVRKKPTLSSAGRGGWNTGAAEVAYFVDGRLLKNPSPKQSWQVGLEVLKKSLG